MVYRAKGGINFATEKWNDTKMNIHAKVASMREMATESELSLTPAITVKVFESPYCLAETKTPRRVHVKKPWMSDSYHRRIQKKWNRRWGFKKEPAAFQTPYGFIMHPQLAQVARRAIDEIAYDVLSGRNQLGL